MERKFLEDLGLDKETIDRVLNQHSSEIGTHKNTISTLNTERDGLKTQLETATREIKSYKDMDIDGIKAKASEWETKYNTDTQTLKDQLESTNYGFAVKEAVAGYRFTSEGAKKAFVGDLTAKKLPLQDGKLLGLEDFKNEYQTSDPGAFAQDTLTPPPYAPGPGLQTLTNKFTPEVAAIRAAAGLKNE